MKQPMSEVGTTYLYLIERLKDYRGDGKSRKSNLSVLDEQSEQWKRVRKATFDRHWENRLYSLEF